MCAWSCNSCAYDKFYTTHLSNIMQFMHTLQGHSPRSLVIAPHSKSKQECGTDTDWVTQTPILHKVRTHLPHLTNYKKFVIYIQSFVRSKWHNHVYVSIWLSNVELKDLSAMDSIRAHLSPNIKTWPFVVGWSRLTLSRLTLEGHMLSWYHTQIFPLNFILCLIMF